MFEQEPTAPQTHEVDTVGDFEQIIRGMKRFALLPYAHDLADGDLLSFKEYDNKAQMYTGRIVTGRVTYVTSVDNHCALSPDALNPDVCIASFELI